MKKQFIFSILAFVSLVFVACSSDDEGGQDGIVDGNAKTTVTLTAMSDDMPGNSSKEVQTRSVLDGMKVKYVANEEIGVFTMNGSTIADKNAKFVNEEATDADGNTVFKGDVTENTTVKYAYFPYTETATATNDGKIDMVLPAEQNAVVGTFDPKANISVAEVSGNNTVFKNVGAVIKFHIQYVWFPGGRDTDDGDQESDPIMSVEFRGNNGEKVAGNITVMAADGTIVGETGDETSVILNRPSSRGNNGFNIHSDYYMVVAPQTYSKGFTMICHTLNNNDIYRVLNKSMTLERNHVYDAGKIVEDANFAAIDLGTYVNGKLVKWADRNVGTYPNDDKTDAVLTQPWDFGGYYAFGEIKTKDEYIQANYKHTGVNVSRYSGDPLYDVAAARWGGDWHTPTAQEMYAIAYNCDWSESEQQFKDISGYFVYNKDNKNNRIFIPAAGIMTENGFEDHYLHYRSDYTSENYDIIEAACYLRVTTSNGAEFDEEIYSKCYNGLPVRPAISE